jgi:hypothetical protein
MSEAPKKRSRPPAAKKKPRRSPKKAVPLAPVQGPKRPAGRPREPVPADVIERLLDYLYDDPRHSLLSFSREPGAPARRTLYQWMAKDPGFRAQVLRAQEDRGEMLADEALEVADFTARDTDVRTGKDGEPIEVPNHEWIARSKLRVDQRMRMAACLNKRYSPKAQVEHQAGESFDTLLRKALGIEKAESD